MRATRELRHYYYKCIVDYVLIAHTPDWRRLQPRTGPASVADRACAAAIVGDCWDESRNDGGYAVALHSTTCGTGYSARRDPQSRSEDGTGSCVWWVEADRTTEYHAHVHALHNSTEKCWAWRKCRGARGGGHGATAPHRIAAQLRAARARACRRLGSRDLSRCSWACPPTSRSLPHCVRSAREPPSRGACAARTPGRRGRATARAHPPQTLVGRAVSTATQGGGADVSAG